MPKPALGSQRKPSEKLMIKPRNEEQIRVRQRIVGEYTSGSLHNTYKGLTREHGFFGELY